MATPEQLAASELLANAIGRRGEGVGCVRVDPDSAVIELRLSDDPNEPGVEQWWAIADVGEFQHRHMKAIDTWIHLPPPPPPPVDPPPPGGGGDGPTDPPPDPPPPVGSARFGWTWCTPLEPTNWGGPLKDIEISAVKKAARSHASHILGWGPTEDPNVLRQYWEARGNPELMLLAKAPAWAKVDGNPSNGDPYDEWGPTPSAWPRLFDYWASIVAEFKPRRVIPWSECRGSAPWGFWDNRPQNQGGNRWAFDHYINFWNQLEPKLRAAHPTVQIGGPYVGMSSWAVSTDGTKGLLDARDMQMVSEFMKRCNFDFVAVDGGIDVRPGYTLPPAGTPEQHVEKLLDVLREVRKVSTKPFVWVETYMHGMVGSVQVKEHAQAWPYLLDQAAKIPGESVWYAWGSQRDMPDLDTLRALAARP